MKDIPSKPTDLEPGSPEKVKLMEQRHEAGQSLWHPLDLVRVNQPPNRPVIEVE